MGEKVDDIFGLSEVKESKGSLIRALIAELMGTLLLVFFGCGAAVAGSRTVPDDSKVGSGNMTVLTSAFITQVALTFGLVVAAVAQVSGLHLHCWVQISMLSS
jgi:glycerol uptake facilitator-like aquaporin